MAFAAIGALSPEQVRVLGCLLEKQRTTPDVYPLSLNALRLACNQSTNRDPVVNYDEEVLRDALHRLERRGLVRLASGAGSRAPKYRHLLAEQLPLASGEQALMCVLMLRGGQTPGELKQRTDRMHSFADLSDVQAAIASLVSKGLVAGLGRRPGQKEERFTELLTDREDSPPDPVPQLTGSPPAETLAGSEDALEQRIARLEREVARLSELVGLRESDQVEA